MDVSLGAWVKNPVIPRPPGLWERYVSIFHILSYVLIFPVNTYVRVCVCVWVCVCEERNKVVQVLSRTFADNSLPSRALIGASIIKYDITHSSGLMTLCNFRHMLLWNNPVKPIQSTVLHMARSPSCCTCNYFEKWSWGCKISLQVL